MKIESVDQDIRTLLSSGYFKIPRFQRPYSWERENVQDFWTDVVKDNTDDYFIGSMVVYKDSKHCFGIVDGQQRLTTITILLCVLRDALDALSFKDLAAGIHGMIERPNIDNKVEFILSTESSYPYFQDRIQKWGKPDLSLNELSEELNLKNAYDQFKSLVNDVIDNIRSDPSITVDDRKLKSKEKLIDIRNSLLDLKLILIKLDNEDDAYLIFETLNTRGKDLSLTDLVKNHITKLLKVKNKSFDQVKIKWNEIKEIIESSSIELETDTFIQHFWLSKYDYLTIKKLFRVLKKKVIRSNAKDFLNDLLHNAKMYRSLHEMSYGKWTKQEQRIKEALYALMLFKVRQQTPCTLSLIREYKNGKIKKGHLEDALIAIEKFHFTFTAITSQRSSGGISSMYASLGRRLCAGNGTQAAVRIIKELKKKLKERSPSYDEFKPQFCKIICTDNITKHKHLVKYILKYIQNTSSKGITIDYNSMTIEHLVPQSKIGTAPYTEEIIGQLGNLILVSDELNNKLKDKQFKDKKKILVDSKYPLPKDISEATDWTEKEIVARTERLAFEAYNAIWKL